MRTILVNPCIAPTAAENIAGSNAVIRSGAEIDYPPFSIVAENGEATGEEDPSSDFGESVGVSTLSVDLMDGRTITVPLAWYPSLQHATPEQLAHWDSCGGGYGIYWPDIDEHLSTKGLLRGAPAPREQLAQGSNLQG